MARHGVRRWTNPERAKETYRRRTGYDNLSQNPDVKVKKERSCLESTGYGNPPKSESVKETKMLTCFGNNGVEYGFMLGRHVVYNSVSGLSRRLYGILDPAGIEYEKEFRIYDSGTYRAYDIAFHDVMAVLELNGDFWHANPSKFKVGDSVNLPHIGETSVTDIWSRDAEKKRLAESRGYNVFCLWESQLNKMNDTEVLDWLKRNVLIRSGKL